MVNRQIEFYHIKVNSGGYSSIHILTAVWVFINAYTIYILEAPTIDLDISSNIVATVGKPAKLLCKVSGDPPPKVTWKRHFFSNNKTMRGYLFFCLIDFLMSIGFVCA